MFISLYEPTKQLDTTNEDVPTIKPYLLKGDNPSAVIIVCPGGGYIRRADHEGEPVAKWLNEIGISAVVLNYRVAPYQFPASLTDAQRAIRLMRHNAEHWNIDPNRVGILGFSAGGHVAASATVHYESENSDAEDPIDRHSSRPDLSVLCYPVITMGDYAHEGSRRNLLGEQPDPSLIEKLSIEKQVTSDTPPVFMWHTSDDASVPVENSYLLAGTLSKNNVPHAVHIFESGRHGLGLANDNSDVKQWTSLCETWLRKRGF